MQKPIPYTSSSRARHGLGEQPVVFRHCHRRGLGVRAPQLSVALDVGEQERRGLARAIRHRTRRPSEGRRLDAQAAWSGISPVNASRSLCDSKLISGSRGTEDSLPDEHER